MFRALFYNEEEPLLFTAPKFWLFFGVVFIIYQLIYQHNNRRNIYLMLVSMYFYYLSGGYYFLLLVFSTLVDYYLGNRIFRSESAVERKWLVTASVCINLGVLAYFKYAYFFTESLNHLLGLELSTVNHLAMLSNAVSGSSFDINSIILPVGISFYTFQTISYSVDIYRRKLTPVKSMGDFAFYVSFFPQLVAGPIVRASEFVPQLYEPYRLNQQEFGRAVFLIINGLVKKILISDYISVNFVDRVFDSPLNYSGLENLLAVYGYSIQIYCDFSGYTDIAIGIALLLGFRLPLNFNSPYLSINITDFWRRWHISLSSWLRDYLYISLGGNRKGQIRTYINLLLTMLLGGLWHGAHFRFIIWGALHGVALALHKMWMELFPARRNTWIGNLLSGVLTFHFVAFCWIFFRATSMDAVYDMLGQIGSDFRIELLGSVLENYKAILLAMGLAYFLHWLPANWKSQVQAYFTVLPDVVKAMLIVLVLLLLYQVRTSEIQPFIYFQF